MKSSFNGQFISFNKKPARKKSIEEPKNIGNIKQSPKDLFDNSKKVEVKRLRSSIFGKKSCFKNKSDVPRSKTNPIKSFRIRKKSKSFDDKLFNIFKKRNKIIEIDSIEMERIRNKRFFSLIDKKKNIISKWQKKFGK